MQQVFRLTKYFGHIIYLFRIYLFICPGIPNEQSAFVRTDSGISLRSDVWCYLPFGKTIYQMAIKNKKPFHSKGFFCFLSLINNFFMESAVSVRSAADRETASVPCWHHKVPAIWFPCHRNCWRFSKGNLLLLLHKIFQQH